jgi:hypothetical protein
VSGDKVRGGKERNLIGQQPPEGDRRLVCFLRRIENSGSSGVLLRIGEDCPTQQIQRNFEREEKRKSKVYFFFSDTGV